MGGLPSLRRLPNAKIVISRHILPIQGRDFSNVAEKTPLQAQSTLPPCSLRLAALQPKAEENVVNEISFWRMAD